MKLNNLGLFIIPAIIWGSTWFVIKFQLTHVNPLWSVSYRFASAGFILMIYCITKGVKLSYRLEDHLRMALQGAFLFGFNYWLVYLAEQKLNSALMAVMVSGIIALNIIFAMIFLGQTTPKKVNIGALLGITGTILIFYQDLKDLTWDELPISNMIYGAMSVIIASLGNVTSAANQKKGIKVIPSNAYGMIYGAVIMALVALFTGVPATIDTSWAYLGSLTYLIIFGSIAAFGTYLTLIGNIGPGRAAYVLVVIPVIALIISTLFEGYQFRWYAGVGVVLILTGNLTIVRR
jgi:drug/metabolite transporter (DMT)-like permease